MIPYYKLLLEPGLMAVHDSILPGNLQQLHEFVSKSAYVWDLKGSPRTDTGLGPFIAATVAPFLVLGLPASAWYVLFSWASAISMLSLCRTLNTGRTASLLSAVSYTYSSFIGNNILAGFSGFIIGYAFAPLVIIGVMRGVHPFNIRYAVLAGMTMGVELTVSLTFAGLLVLVFPAWTLLLFLTSNNALNLLHKFANAAKFAGASLLIVLGINSYWIVPAAATYLSTKQTRFDLGYHLATGEIQLWSSFNPPAKTMMGLAPSDFFYAIQSVGGESLYVLASVLLLILATLSLMFSKKTRAVSFFLLILVISFWFGNGTNPPFGGIYEWMYLNLPLFPIFNRPYYFQALTAISVSALLGLSLDPIFKQVGERAKYLEHAKKPFLERFSIRTLVGPRARVGILALILGLLVLSSSQPMLSGDFLGQLRPVNLPQSYQDLANWLANHEQGRILYLPPYEGMRLKSLNSYPSFPSPLVEFPVDSPVTLQGVDYDQTTPWIVNMLYLNRTTHVSYLLGLLGIRYIVVDLDYRDFEWAPYQNTTNLYQSIQQLPGLEEVWNEGSLHVLVNQAAPAIVSLSSNIAAIDGDRRALLALGAMENYSYSNVVPVFMEQLSPSQVLEVLRLARFLLTQNSSLEGLALATTQDSTIISPWNFATQTVYDYNNGWTTSSRVQNPEVWRHPYYIDAPFSDTDPWILSESVFNRSIPIDLPFSVSRVDTYDIWAKVFVGYATFSGPNESPYVYGTNSLQFYLDGQIIHNFDEYYPNPGRFEWVKLGQESLSGSHVITLVNSGGLGIVSKLIVAPSLSVRNAEELIQSTILQNNMQTIFAPTSASQVVGAQESTGPVGQPPPNHIVNTSSSYGILTQGNALDLTYQDFFARNGNYTIELAITGRGNINVSISIDGSTSLSRELTSSTSKLINIEFALNLQSGLHSLAIRTRSDSRVEVDEPFIVSGPTSPESYLGYFAAAEDQVRYQRLSSPEFSASLPDVSGSSVLLVRENYNPLWEAMTPDGPKYSIPIYSWANGFIIDKGNNFDIVYEPHQYWTYGVFATLASISTCIVIIVFRRRHSQ